MSYSSSDSSVFAAIVGIVVVVAIVVGILFVGISGINHMIHNDQAVERFQELAGTNNVLIVRHSNNVVIVGDPFDVTYELLADGKPVGGRCTSGWFSPMVCRLYTLGGD